MRADGNPGMSDEEVKIYIYSFSKNLNDNPSLNASDECCPIFSFSFLFPVGEGFCIPLLASIQGLPSHTLLRRTSWR